MCSLAIADSITYVHMGHVRMCAADAAPLELIGVWIPAVSDGYADHFGLPITHRDCNVIVGFIRHLRVHSPSC